jgi:hypothetical protein
MRKIIATAGILAVMSTSVFAQATARPEFPHPDAVAQYLLKDGSTLYVYKDGKMAMENKVGTAVYMKEGVSMETKDGKKIMMKGNELWRVESHRVNP